MKPIISVFIISAALIFTSSVVALAHHGPETIVLPARMGDVTFQHFAHQDQVDDCTTCHHAGVDAGKCSSCHGVNEDAPNIKDAYHNLCRDCHQDIGGKAPTKCKECHVK